MQINRFWENIFLPLIWMTATGSFTLPNFALGFVLSSLCLWLLSSPSDVPIIVTLMHAVRLIRLAGFFLRELVLANIRVAWEVITPRDYMRPAIIAIPLDTVSDLQTTVLANFITLTPGTLTLDVLTDRKTMYVHAMFVDDPDQFRIDIKQRLERRVIEVFK